MTAQLKVEIVRIERMCVEALAALKTRYKYYGCIKEIRLSTDLYNEMLNVPELAGVLELRIGHDDILRGIVGSLLNMEITIDSPIIKDVHKLPAKHAMVFYVDPDTLDDTRADEEDQVFALR